MKNKILIAVLFVATLLVTGCGGASNGGFVGTPNTSDTNKQGVLTCNYDKTENDVKFEYVYEITYTGDYVDKLETSQTVITDNNDVLNRYMKQFASYIDSSFDGYSVQVLAGGNATTLTTTIDYTKVDLEKLSSVSPTDVALVKDGKLLVSDIQTMYESMGATCK